MSAPASAPAPGFRKYPEHKVALFRDGSLRRIWVLGRIVAETRDTIVVEETRHGEVVYVARSALKGLGLSPTETKTYCPFKGEASYWSLAVGGAEAVDAAWSYESPYSEVLELAGYLAFYPDRARLVVEELT